jgi:hypothetical protein
LEVLAADHVPEGPLDRRHGPIVNDQNINATDSGQQMTQASISSGQGQVTRRFATSEEKASRGIYLYMVTADRYLFCPITA